MWLTEDALDRERIELQLPLRVGTSFECLIRVQVSRQLHELRNGEIHLASAVDECAMNILAASVTLPHTGCCVELLGILHVLKNAKRKQHTDNHSITSLHLFEPACR